MRKNYALTFLFCLLAATVMAQQPAKRHLSKERIAQLKAQLEQKKSLRASKAAASTVILAEDFSKFTEGSEAQPSTQDVCDPADYYYIPDSYTLSPGWSGVAVYQAGGKAYIGITDAYGDLMPGDIDTPIIDFSGTDGNVIIKFKAKSTEAEGDYFLAEWYDLNDDDGTDYDVVQIDNTWKEYTIELAVPQSDIVFLLYSYDYPSFVDDIEFSIASGSVLPAPVALEATGKSASGFTANWNPVDGAIAYQLDVYTKTGNPVSSVLSENFDKFTAGGTGSSAHSTDISGTLDTYTQTPGWTGSKIYQAGGTTKFGTASLLGYIVTPSIDLSAYGGAFTLSFDAMAWSGDATSLKIYLNDQLVETVSDLDNSSSYTIAPYSLDLTGGTATSKLKFEGQQAAKGRFFLDNLNITQGGETITPVTGSPFTVANISYPVSGLSAGTYYYTVTAKDADGGVSVKSNEISVSLDASSLLSALKAPSIYAANGQLILGNTSGVAEIYSISGQLVGSVPAQTASVSTKQFAKGVYLVKVNGKAFKVIF